MKIDLADIAFFIGMILVGCALFLAVGTPGAIGFAGGVMIGVGIILARRQAAKKTGGAG